MTSKSRPSSSLTTTTPFPPQTPSTIATPPLLSIQLPFVLLGNKKEVNPSTDAERLTIIHETFSKLRPNFLLKVWQGSEFQEDDGVTRILRHDKDRLLAKEALEKRRRAWSDEQEKKWKTLEQSGAWILRLTPTSPNPNPNPNHSSAIGIIHPHHADDAHFTAREDRALGNRAWKCGFMLQRGGVVVENVDDKKSAAWRSFAWEVDAVFDVLQHMDKFVHPDLGRLFRVVGCRRGWGRMGFRLGTPAGKDSGEGVGVGWDEDTVANLFILLSGCERELLSLSTPDLLISHWPLSNFLAKREVRRLKLEKEELIRGVVEGVGKGRKERWGKVKGEWLEKLEFADKKARFREDVLRVRREWWEDVGEIVMGEGEGAGDGVGGLVRDVRRWERRGQRLCMGFYIDENEDEDEDEEKDGKAKTKAQEEREGNDHQDKEEAEKEPKPFPHIHTITLPLPPKHSLNPTHVLAHISLISHILLFATSHSPSFIYDRVKRMRETSALGDETPVETLDKVCRAIDVDEETYNTLISALPSLDGQDDKDKDRDGINETADESSTAVGKDIWIFNPMLRFLEKERRKEREFMRGFVERYEQAGGFLVLRRMRLLAIMEYDEAVERERERVGVEERGWEEVVRWVDGVRERGG
ncbi:hypothetical protein CC80DRAFT_548261 [Byssothecium circinans]|uniref:Uncharacterized protein n=1 Tax=Byssothecium circinans TaxID=147558 RepID=A0A6A5U180_9PLEO|nr:hypothetical protein CC80DRAFT_548261 [Byssothecium circinans]